MSKLDKLIQKLCPDGVEYRPLEQCCIILDNKRKPVTKGSREAGEYPYYGANGIQDYVSDYIFDGTFVLVGEDGSVITSNGNPVVTWAEGKIWVNNHAHIVSEIEGVLLRYLYHFIQTVDISNYVHGNIPKLTGKDFRGLEVPVPPLEVQREIVRVLDKFTLLRQELSAELSARKKQYEYYRDELLSVSGEEKTLEEVAQVFDSLHQTPKYVSNGVSMIRVQDVVGGVINTQTTLKVSEEDYYRFSAKYEPQENDIVISRVGSFGRFGVVPEEKCCLGQNVSIIHPLINPRYLYYYISTKQIRLWIEERAKGSGHKAFGLSDIKKIPILVPPEDVQKRVSEILDIFECLINDIWLGLPAEIEARTKQYEYYRDKLLTFKRKEIA